MGAFRPCGQLVSIDEVRLMEPGTRKGEAPYGARGGFGDRSIGLMSYHMGRARLERELADGVPPRDRYVDRVLSSCGSDCG